MQLIAIILSPLYLLGWLVGFVVRPILQGLSEGYFYPALKYHQDKLEETKKDVETLLEECDRFAKTSLQDE